MNDQIETTPNDDEAAAAAIKHIEEIQAEAKATFSLRDRLKGFKPQRKVLPLFLNLEAVGEYQIAKAEADAIFAQAERPGILPEVQRGLLAQHDEKLSQASAAREAMLADTISAHLVTLPNDVVKATRSKARLEAKAAAKGRPLTEQEQEDLAETVARRTLALGIERLVQSDGATISPVTEEHVRELEAGLPTVQWDNLYSTFETMLFSQQTALAAVEEPGF